MLTGRRPRRIFKSKRHKVPNVRGAQQAVQDRELPGLLGKAMKIARNEQFAHGNAQPVPRTPQEPFLATVWFPVSGGARMASKPGGRPLHPGHAHLFPRMLSLSSAPASSCARLQEPAAPRKRNPLPPPAPHGGPSGAGQLPPRHPDTLSPQHCPTPCGEEPGNESRAGVAAAHCPADPAPQPGRRTCGRGSQS